MSSKPRLWTPLFVLVIVMTLCVFLVGQGLNAGTSVYLAAKGQPAALAGAMAFVFSAAAALARVACGLLVDTRGRFAVLLGGFVILLIGTAGTVVASDPVSVVVWRVLQGVGFSAATTAVATMAADVLPQERLGEGIGYSGLGQALAMSVGPAFALFLVGTEPAENLYVGLSVVALAGLFLALFCRYEKDASGLPPTSAYRQRWERERARSGEARADARNEAASADAGSLARDAAEPSAAAPAKRLADGASASKDAASEAAASAPPKEGLLRRVFEPRALPGAVPMMAMAPTFGFGIFFVGLYGTELGIANAALFYTVSALAMIVVRLKSGAFMDRVAPLKIHTAAVVAGLVACALLLAAPVSTLAYYAAGIFYGVCLGVSMPLGQSVAVKNTPPERWGAASALYLLLIDVSIGSVTAVWGFVNDAFGFSVTIMCVMGCIAVSMALACLLFPRVKAAPLA